MKTKTFLSQVNHDEIVAAIRQAEAGTSAEIRVFISRKKTEDALVQANAEFKRLKMDETEERNGVLLFVAPESQKFALIGDSRIHEKCGQAFWETVTVAISDRFRQGEFTQGITHGIREAGKLLASHFPRQADDKNELPDKIAHD